MRILIADDDPGMRDILTIFMNRMDYDTDAAENGIKALDLLGKIPYDVVITDGEMPGMTGFELCRAVRERFPHIFIVGLTGSARLQEFAKAGAHVFYYKPVQFQMLQKAIESHFHEQVAPAA